MSGLQDAIEAGRFLVTAEMPTVDGGGLEAVRERLTPIADWVDAVNATDNTAAHAHASSVGVAIALAQLGVEPVLQLVCRDRNRLALQADIMGAALHGIENICCLTGDDVTAGDEPETRRVFDLDGPQLVALATTLASGRYLSGRTIDPAPHLFVGAVENPGAPPFEYRVDRALKKVARRRAVSAAAGVLPDRVARTLPGRSGAQRPGCEGGAAAFDLPRALPRPLASSTRRCPASRCRRSTSSAASEPPIPRPSASSSPASSPTMPARNRVSADCT